MNGILTVKQIATKLQVNKVTVYRWLRDGKLAGYRANKLWRIAEDDLTSFLKQRTGAESEHGETVDYKSNPDRVADSAPRPQM